MASAPLTPAQEQRLRVWSLTSPDVRGPKFPWDELRGLFDLLDAERAARTPAAPASGDALMLIKIDFVGPAALHNLACWLCGEAPAVYDMHPNWCFRPCWACQRKIKP